MDDGYFEYLRLPQGDYLGQESGIVPRPDLFTPDRVETSSLRGGVAFSMRVMEGIKAAVGYDRARVKVRSTLLDLDLPALRQARLEVSANGAGFGGGISQTFRIRLLGYSYSGLDRVERRQEPVQLSVLPRENALWLHSIVGAFKKRLPMPGSVITRDYKGQKLHVKVLAQGFEYDGDEYKSLSAVAKVITGTH